MDVVALQGQHSSRAHDSAVQQDLVNHLGSPHLIQTSQALCLVPPSGFADSEQTDLLGS